MASRPSPALSPADRSADRNAARRPILVVDDDRKIAALVRAYLEREGYRVRTAHDGREALELARADPPEELIVLDLMLPEIDGLEVMRRLRRIDVPVLMLSARSSLPERIRGLEKGADDYLPKPFSPAEVVVRVKAILRRSAATGTATATAPHRGTILRQADLIIDTGRYEVHRGSDVIALTPVEFRLLVTLVSADGRALSRSQLLDAVYGADDDEILDRTIDVHVGRLRDKLGDNADEPRYVMTVRGVGYRAAPPRAPR